MVDLVETIRAVVLPAVEAVFQDHELDALDVRIDGESVHVTLTARGEVFVDAVI